jgi:hypothetical protein
VAFDRAIAPRQPQAGVDGLIVREQPSSQALQGRDATGDGACQPRIETVGLTLAHTRTKVLCQPHGFGHVMMVALEVREELGVRRGAMLGPLQHQPGRSARGQWLVRRFGDTRERLAQAPRAWPYPLGWTETLRIARHGGGAPRVPMASEVSKQL